MLFDRSELNKKFNIDNYFPDFISVLIPEIARPDYVTECVNSIHKHADMPIEIILHDDGSGREKQQILYNNLKDKVSTFIFNMGYNTGLARAFNRCRDMASSEYMVGFNSDVYVTSSFFRAIKDALDLPYVGMVGVTPHIADNKHVYISKNGHKIALHKGTSNCHCFGIKKTTWDNVGRWDEKVQTTSSDTGFIGTVFGYGYFTVYVEGTITNEMWLKSDDGKVNISDSNPNYVETAQFCRGDNNLPPIFGIPENDHKFRCERRREDIYHGVNNFNQKDNMFPHWYNHIFQNDQVLKLFTKDGIDWEFAKVYGHDKWKDMVINDFKQ